MNTPVRYRPLAFGVTRAVLREGAPGTRYLQAEAQLAPYAERMTDRLRHWAETAPDRTFIARRERLPGGGTGDWIRVSYAEAHQKARSIGQAEGLFVESLMAAIASGDPAAKERIKAFLEGKAAKVSKAS
jgi:hypothetical protein